MGEQPKDRPRVVVASTLSAYGDRVIDRGCMVAQSLGAELVAVHVIDPGILPDRFVIENMEKAQAVLREEIASSPLGGSLEARTEVLLGQPEEALAEYVVSHQVDLVVVGVSREFDLKSTFSGTRVEKVVRASPCPVIIVKRRPRADYKSIAVALDLEGASRHAFEVALRTFPSARFTVLHAGERSSASLVEDVVVARCASAGLPLPGTANSPDIVIVSSQGAEALHDEIVRLEPDLVVMGTHGRGRVAKLFLGSVAGTLLELLPCDVMIARAPLADGVAARD